MAFLFFGLPCLLAHDRQAQVRAFFAGDCPALAVKKSNGPFDAQVNTLTYWVDEIINSTDDEVSQRLAELDQGLVEHRDDPVVRRRIAAYVEYWRSGTEVLLGRAARFFPIFEQELTAAAMPDAIKYLTVPESALRPWAISEVGAAGLWQLMPGTARELGLRVDSLIDERQDLRLSTRAGLAYLAKQYDRFEDWTLALAAYNCGPGGVLRAIRRSGSKNYWRMRRYLPRETRNYLPNYIAAVYLSAYFHAHQLEPATPSLDLTMIESVPIHGFVSLHRIAQVCRLRPAEVLNLNPAYLKGYVPDDGQAHYVYLPSRVVPALQAYLQLLEPDQAEEDWPVSWLSPRLDQGETQADQYYAMYRYYLFPADSSYTEVAQILDVPVTLLHTWNYSGTADSLTKREYLDYYRVEHELEFGPYAGLDTSPSPILAPVNAKPIPRRLFIPQITIPAPIAPLRRRKR
ncbi:MAG: transglycosylase SLT domain-containing protein [Bacteroidota bacterium]